MSQIVTPPPQPPSKLVVRSPEEFNNLGLTIVEGQNTLDDPDIQKWRSHLTTIVKNVPSMVSRPPRPYQFESALIGMTRPNNLFAYEAGTGKSYIAALVIMGLFSNGYEPMGGLLKHRPGTIHIVAPKHTLRLVWVKELVKAGLVQLNDKHEIIGGVAEIIDSEKKLRLSKAPIFIYHYDFLKSQTAKGREKKRKEPLFKLIRKRWHPTLLVMDEVHRLRTGTERTHAVKELRKKAKRVLALTGTPMDGWVEHLANILGVVYRENSAEFPYTVSGFTRKFTRKEMSGRDYVTGNEDGKAVKKRPAPGIAVDQLPLFYRTTAHLMHRLTFADPRVSPFVVFPKMDHHIIKLTMTPEHKAHYDAVHTKVMKQIYDAIQAYDAKQLSYTATRANVLTHLNALRAAVNYPWEQGGPQTTVKIEALKDFALQAKAEGRKFIIFTNRIAVGRKLQEVMKAAGVNTVRIYDTDEQVTPKNLNQEARDILIEKFQEDPDVHGMIGNTELVSEGLTLIEASKGAHADHDWRSHSWSQANARYVRPGQEYDPTFVGDYLIDQTVDCYVHAGMLKKAKATLQTIDRQFDGGESATIDPLDVARTLLQEDQYHEPESSPGVVDQQPG